MNININYFSHHALSFFKGKTFPSLTIQQKKILTAASVAFGFLAFCYVLKRCLKTKPTMDAFGVVTGKGERKWGKEGLSKGVFKNGKLNGQGEKIYHPQGDRAKGSFKDDLLEGQGEVICADGKKYQGTFEKDRLVKGKMTIKGMICEGNFKNDKLDGIGTIIYPNGDKLQGLFKEDLLEGQGEVTCVDGRKYKGLFSKNNLVEGTFTTATGIVQEGKFQKGFLHGPGKITYPNGKVEEGIFQLGVLTQPKP